MEDLWEIYSWHPNQENLFMSWEINEKSVSVKEIHEKSIPVWEHQWEVYSSHAKSMRNLFLAWGINKKSIPVWDINVFLSSAYLIRQ